MELFLTLGFSSIKAILFVLLLGFLPGWLICNSLSIKTNTAVWSHGLSILLFSLILWASAQLSVPLGAIQPSIIIGFSLVFLLLLLIKQKLYLNLKILQENIPSLIILATVTAYFSFVGVYDLVPSDILRHMERTQAAARDLANPNYSQFIYFNGLFDHYHYYFYALFMEFSHLNIQGTFWFISVLNTALLFSALYEFARYQNIEKHINPQANKQWDQKYMPIAFAVICILFFSLTKGIAGFSFFRYYSLAPTLFSFAVFLALIIKIDYYLLSAKIRKDILIIPLGMAILLFWHLQELLFTLVTTSLLILYYVIYSKLNIKNKLVSLVKRPWLTITLLSTILIIAILLIIRITFDLPSTNSNKLLTLPELFNIFLPSDYKLVANKNLTILNPFIQFSQVLGFWGILVYCVASFNLKTIIQKPLLICGLLIPFFTVFNPLFVDLFLRIRGEDTLYRLLYAIPLSTVAAYILVVNINCLFIASRQKARNTPSVKNQLIPLLSIIILCAGLIPFNSTTLLTQYNRTSEILPVNSQHSLRHWQDITRELSLLPKQDNILTDPVTGYIITATTQHTAKRYKFTKSQHLDLNELISKKILFSQFKGQYLVINLRNGSTSKQGLLSTHWPSDILKVKNYYSPELLEYIHSNPSTFAKLWENDGATIYRIQE